MINSAPNNPKYNQGIYYPKNKDKVIKLNAKGGLYYRSSLEKKMMHYLDFNDKIINWGAENIKIPYQKTEMHNESQQLRITEHIYYPDFYYEILSEDGTLHKVVAEVKPESETIEPRLPINPTTKQLKNFEYALKMWNKNLSKWEYIIDWCNRKGMRFIIITDKILSKN
jgi:hypothetical protein